MNQPYIKSQLSSQAEDFFKNQKNLEFPECLACHYPHVLNRTYLLWGNHTGIKEYFNSLILMTNQQQGFMMPAFKEIMKLQSFYEELFPEYNETIEKQFSKSSNIWDIHDYKHKR